MATFDFQHRHAHNVGEVEEVAHTDLHLINDGDSQQGPPADPPINLLTSPPSNHHGRGLAVPLLYASMAATHIGGDERETAMGVLYAVLALLDLCAEE